MSILDNLSHLVDRGRTGVTIGLPTGLPRLDKACYGINSSRYTLIGGHTGTGKTALITSAYIFNPLYESWHSGRPAKKYVVCYFNLEMPNEIMVLNAIRRDMAILTIDDEYPHGRYFSLKAMMGWGTSDNYWRIDDATYELFNHCKESYRDYFDNGKIRLYETLSPNIFKTVCKEYGEFYQHSIHSGEFIVQIIVDHLGKIRPNSGQTKKDAIDEISYDALNFRNKYGLSFVFLSQFNRAIEAQGRKGSELNEPQLSDFKYSGDTQEDADEVYGLYYPAKYKVERYLGYKIEQGLDKSFRSLHVMKHRYGQDGRVLGLFFNGALGLMKELPKSSEMTDEHYEYYHREFNAYTDEFYPKKNTGGNS